MMYSLEILEMIKEKDRKFQENVKSGTHCSQCHKNAPVGLYPFWHRYARTLCEDCQKDYKELLTRLKACGERIE